MTDLRDQLRVYFDEVDPPFNVSALMREPQPELMPTRNRLGRSALVAVAAAVLVLLAVGVPLLLSGRQAETVVEPSVTTVPQVTTTLDAAPNTTVAEAPTTTPPPTTLRPTPAAPAEVVPFPPSELAVLEVPLSEAIPGFSDTIVMSAWSDKSDGDGVMRWRSSESMTELLLSPEQIGGGWSLGLDTSANWVALTLDVDVLSAQALPTVPGELSQREIVGHDADDVVWHDTESGHLAWLECPNSFDGPTTLVTLDVSDPSADPIRVRSFDQGCLSGFWGEDESNLAKPVVILEGWGRTGMWVTKRSEDWVTKYSGGAVVDLTESVLVDADGAEIAMVSDAQMIAMNPDGTSIWRRSDWEEPCFVVSPDGQQRSAVPGLSDEDFLGKARWSPDGTRLAMWVATDGGRSSGEEVLRIVDSVSGEVITELKEPEEPDWESAAAWSTDNRFFVYAPDSEGPATLVFYDTATNTTTMVPIAEDVSDIRVR